MQLTLTISDDLKNDYVEAGAALVAFNKEIETAAHLAAKYLDVCPILLNDETKKKKNELEEREGDLYTQISKALMTSAIEQMTEINTVEAKPVPKKEKAKKVKVETETVKVETVAPEVKPIEEQVHPELPPYLKPIYEKTKTKLQFESIAVLDEDTKCRIVSNFYELETHAFTVSTSDDSLGVLRLKDLISFDWNNTPTEEMINGYINLLKIIFEVSKKELVQKLCVALVRQFMLTKSKFCQETNNDLKTAGEAVASFLRAVDEANQRVSIKDNATSDDLLEELLKNVKDTKLPTETQQS